MSTVYLDVYCPNCKSESVIVAYAGEDIRCTCVSCNNTGGLKNFEYIIESYYEDK